jgi:hypothetical protein
LSFKHNFSIIRFKGIFYGEGKVYSIQGLYELYEINEVHVKEKKTSENKSKILFIGENIKEHLEIIRNTLNIE